MPNAPNAPNSIPRTKFEPLQTPPASDEDEPVTNKPELRVIKLPSAGSKSRKPDADELFECESRERL